MKPIELVVPWLPPWAWAVTLWPLILYRREAWEDATARAHERYHWHECLRWGVIP